MGNITKLFQHRLGLALSGALLATAMFGSGPSFAGEKLKAVVEMFTSQGCSSCPPADKVLSGYAKSDDVLALSWHVDYWNYLGWKDTFSKADFTERQRNYAVSFRRRGVYTPQAVVNGRTHAVGSQRSEIESLISTFQSNGQGLTVPVELTMEGDQLKVRSGENSDARNATLWIVYFDRSRDVKITKGENRGQTITYHNVVRDVSMLGMADNGKIDITLPLKTMKQKGHEACALILQETTASGQPGAIIGATVINDLLGS